MATSIYSHMCFQALTLICVNFSLWPLQDLIFEFPNKETPFISQQLILVQLIEMLDIIVLFFKAVSSIAAAE